jgi:hypothetical protein
MKRLAACILLVACLSQGAEKIDTGKNLQKPWYNKGELEKVAKSFALQKKINFTFEGTKSSVSYKRVGTNLLATIWFASELGKPTFQAEIDHTRTVLTNSIAITVCGTGRKQ